MPCICKCRSDEIEKEKQKDEYEQRMHAINRLKDASMMASKFRDANFSGYKVRKFYAWYFGCTEEEAKEYIPEENTYPPEE